MPCNNDTLSDNLDGCGRGFWDLSFLVSYWSLLTFSIAINCCLLYLALKHRHPRHPQYTILANLAVCDFLEAFILSVHVLPSVVQGKTAILSKWCISFVPIFGDCIVACQLTWTLLAAERYTFICQGIHYRQIVTTRHIRWALSVIWTIVLLLNTYHQVVIHCKLDIVAGRPLQDTLICDPLTLEKITELTSVDLWLLRGPPGSILLLAVVSIFTCYFRIFRAARKVARDLRQSNSRAALHVGCYLVMFLAQMLPFSSWIAMSVVDQIHPGTIPRTQSQHVMIIMMMVTPSANVLTVICCNKEFKEELLLILSFKGRCRVGPAELIRAPEEIEMRELRSPQIQGRACDSNGQQ